MNRFISGCKFDVLSGGEKSIEVEGIFCCEQVGSSARRTAAGLTQAPRLVEPSHGQAVRCASKLGIPGAS